MNFTSNFFINITCSCKAPIREIHHSLLPNEIHAIQEVSPLYLVFLTNEHLFKVCTFTKMYVNLYQTYDTFCCSNFKRNIKMHSVTLLNVTKVIYKIF